ncbi:hypothetical protein [Propionivibrio sp.]|uniref:hypothetical protein n=1 Tax=Propionivibrio sp. TaxID=2212460 RepID=UPI003BF4E8B0
MLIPIPCHSFHIPFETLPAIPAQSRRPTDASAIKNSTSALSIFGYPDFIDGRFECCVAADFKWIIYVEFLATDSKRPKAVIGGFVKLPFDGNAENAEAAV